MTRLPAPDPRAAEQFVEGFHHAVLAGAGLTIVAALIAVAFLGKAPHHEGEPAFEGA